MKKALFIAVCLLMSLYSIGQITLEHTYNNADQIRLVNLSISGDKYAVRDDANNELRLYNMNHSIWKTINVPTYAGYEMNYADYVSEELFDGDALVEVEIGYANISTTGYRIDILKENGTVINSFLDAYGGFVYPDASNNFKLLITDYTSVSKVYSLPGTLPCGLCGGLGLNKSPERRSAYLSGPIPNPSSELVTINYQLPQGVNKAVIELYNLSGQQIKSYTVDRSFTTLTLNNEELAPGNYYYTLKAAGIEPSARKMVIIK